MELSKTFDAKAAEERWFQVWIDRGYFTADPNREGEVFSIVFPPPNVTGQLHLGHALNVTLHDVIVRTRRMQGYNTLWLPGTDHAGIATQNVVEREIAKEGKTRHDLGRERFVERVWAWRERYGNRILEQLRRLGASCDWSRERFTLDEGLSRAVTKVFVMLFNGGLIYRDFRLINWCPRCETALSDLEVEHKEAKGSLWYITYPLTEGAGAVTVATTRPETMLGDTAVAVHPEDDRYRDLVGKLVRLPLMGREIPIIAEAAVDRAFGSGAVKITPGHDFNDFEMGRRHGLAQISVMDTHGRMAAAAGVYQGLTREECRKCVVADLEAAGLLAKIEPHQHKIGVCSRCDTIVEPMLSYQWFLAVNKPDAEGESLAGRAIKAVEQGATTFHPKFWENTYFSWMRNLQDWCISRQLWWGHRIPAYWCQSCEKPEPIVSEERPASCAQCGGADLRQDDDVLDTWFSSGLWPFSTLGWPGDSPDLKKYYPTSLLITGFDIIFFWVARMMMFGLKVNPNNAASMEDAVPFRDVYITPLVRDQFGKKMTKSRGNVVDPLEIMDKYGTDAVRFTLAQLSVQGRDLILSEDRLAASRAFANKIWNAARFVLMNLEGAPQPLPVVELSKLDLAERWIISRLDTATREVTAAIDAYEFNRAALIVYQFVWHEFCDWYIELAKEPLKAGGERQAAARYVLVTCFDRMLRILHPFMPFISEEIWQVLRPYFGAANLPGHLAIAGWPVLSPDDLLSESETKRMRFCISAVERSNSLRSFLGYHPGQRINVNVIPNDNVDMGDREQWSDYVKILVKADSLGFLASDTPRPPRTYVYSETPWALIGVETPADFDFGRARDGLKKRLAEAETHLERNQNRFNNPGFRAKADEETVAEIVEKIEELKVQKAMLEGQLSQLQ
ncbi:MAG TPA: valine--tRNA ligase [Candidatus Binataceae bacterium]|nr:valine--tRNA ligase [Candidatus Binataceae bacterium]